MSIVLGRPYTCRKTLPCTKGIKTFSPRPHTQGQRVERHCPVRKGLRLINIEKLPTFESGRKTLPCTKGIKTVFSYQFLHFLFYVERHCPVRKGLRPLSIVPTHHVPPCRKTLPCTKGIKTFTRVYLHNGSVERHCPVRKGLRHSFPFS